LICYQIFLAYFNSNIIEGLATQEYKPYDTNDPDKVFKLAQQNTGNIIALKQEVRDMSSNIIALQSQVNGLVQAQQEYAQKMTPSSPPQISGAVQS